jgi:hypothetical protein
MHEIFLSQSNSFLAISFQSFPTADSLNSISSCSKAHISIGWRLETELIFLKQTLLYNHFAGTKHKTQPLYCWKGVFTAPLLSKGSYSNIAYVLVAAGMCLPSRCLTMNIYSDFTIPAFGCHATIRRIITCVRTQFSIQFSI